MSDRYILISAIAVLLAACSGADETIRDDGSADPTDLISYTVETSQTRSAVIKGTQFPTNQSFRVWAFVAGSSTPLIDGDIVSCTDGSAWSTQSKYYWPKGDPKITFYALYPTVFSINKDIKRFTYTVPTAVESQSDILYDMVTASKTDDGVSHNPIKRYAVPLTLRHALTQIAFKGRVSTNNMDWTVSVTDIKVCNVMGTGTFDLTTGMWSSLSGTNDFKIGLSSSPVTFGSSTSTATDLTASDGVLLLIPQTLLAWDLQDNVSNTSGSYLAITCHIKEGDTDLIGTTTTPTTVYVPFDSGSSSWKRGNRYTYTLEFGTGYSADGQNQFRVLIVGSEITDWADGEGGDIGAKMTQEDE